MESLWKQHKFTPSARDWFKKNYTGQKFTNSKNPHFYSDLADILPILPTHGLIILTKFDED